MGIPVRRGINAEIWTKLDGQGAFLRRHRTQRMIGVGAKVGEAKRDELMGLTNGLEWVTYHYGLVAMLVIMSDRGDVAKN